MTAEAMPVPRQGLDYRWLVLAVTTIGSFMSLLNMTMINIGLPKILTSFGVDIQEGQWVLTSYMIALSVVIPVSGFLAEKIGMKRLYMITMALFILGSALCGLSWNLPSLIAFRIFQGLGGGMLQPLGMAIVFSVVTPRERPQFMPLLGLPMLVAPLVGPTVGGYLVQYVDWRTIFTLNIPIGLLGLSLAGLLLRETPTRRNAPLDTPGFLLSSIGFPTLLLGVNFGSRDGWNVPVVELLLAVGVLSLAAWVIVELVQPEPMLDLRIFANPIFSLAMALNFIIQLSLFGAQLLLPLFLQTAQGLGALEAGLILVPQGIVSFLSMNVSGRLYNRLGPRPLVLFGLGLMAVTTWQLSHLGLGTSSATVTFLAMARGFSMGFCMMPIMTAAFNTVPQPKMPRATALSNGIMRVFGAFSTAFLATLLHSRSLFHYSALTTAITPTRPAVVALISRLQPRVVGIGVTTAMAQQRAAARIVATSVAQHSLVMAFNDAFLLMTLVTLLAVPLALFLKDDALKEGAIEGSPRDIVL